MEEKVELIEEIKKLIATSEEEVVEINPNFLEYFTIEELNDIKNNLLYKKENFHEHSKEFVNELYEKTKKVGI